MIDHDLDAKLKQSAIIKRQTEEFLSKGGQIKQLDSIKCVADIKNINYRANEHQRVLTVSNKKEQVIRMWQDGEQVKDISLALSISHHTINGYIRGIKRGCKKDNGG